MESVVLLHPFLDFFVCSLRLSTCRINLIQINLNLDMIIRFLLGQKNYRLHMSPHREVVKRPAAF